MYQKYIFRETQNTSFIFNKSAVLLPVNMNTAVFMPGKYSPVVSEGFSCG
jgi:hypothetical protein